MDKKQYNFINELSAYMEKTDNKEDYIEKREKALNELNKIENLIDNIKIKTIEDFEYGSEIKSLLSSLFCYAFNNEKENWEEVNRIETKIGKKLLSFVKKQVANKEDNRKIRYLLANKRLVMDYYARKLLIIELIKKGYIYKDDYNYLTTGLHKKIGDNVFTVDRLGRQHRVFINTCGLQAFYLHDRDIETIKEILEHSKTIKPEDIKYLPRYYSKINFGDGKWLAKRPRLTARDINIIRNYFRDNFDWQKQ